MKKQLYFLSLLISSILFAEERTSMQTNEFSFMLKPSTNNDIGLFALQDIPKGTLIFNAPFKMRIIKTKDIPQELQEFSLQINEEESACPERFDRMEIGWYMNHSSTHANIEKRITQTYENAIDLLEALTFYSIRDIKAGEEILINSNLVKEKFPA